MTRIMAPALAKMAAARHPEVDVACTGPKFHYYSEMSNSLTVTAAEANRSFSKLLRAARNGQSVTITSHGEPVAVLGPVETAAEREERDAAWERIRARWAQATPVVIDQWNRDDIYDEVTR
jgi:prevent-host-death family protein